MAMIDHRFEGFVCPSFDLKKLSSIPVETFFGIFMHPVSSIGIDTAWDTHSDHRWL